MKSPRLIIVLVAGSLFLLPSRHAAAQAEPSETPPPDSFKGQLPSAVGESLRLDELPPEPPEGRAAGKPATREIENLPVPLRRKPEGRLRVQPEGLTPTTKPLAAALLSKFDGLRQGTNYRPRGWVYPPDANGSVSRRWYFQWVNSYFTKIDKQTGRMAIRPTNGSQIWRSLHGDLCGVRNDGDPIVIFDKAAGRWLLTQFAVDVERARFAECIAISEDDDPTSSYTLFEFKFPLFNDYPKFGIWRDGYYVSFNMAAPPDYHQPPFGLEEYQIVGARVCVFERDKMLSPSLEVRKTARMKCFNPKDEVGNAAGAVLPADIDGSRLPPEGSPEYVLGLGNNPFNDHLLLWQIKVDWADLDRSTISEPILIEIAPFEMALCDSSDSMTCIPQKGTHTVLDSMGERLMNRLSYRNFGDREALFVTHSVKAGNGFGVRWYELSRDLPARAEADFAVRQQQTFAPDNAYRWLGSMASDKMGNLLITYNVSDKRSYPSFRFAGRRASDPLSALSAEGVIAVGKRSVGGTQREAGSRWGDYGSVSLDPDDDCTFWATGQYTGARGGGGAVPSSAPTASSQTSAPAMPTSGPEVSSAEEDEIGDVYFWDTVVASMKFPDCH